MIILLFLLLLPRRFFLLFLLLLPILILLLILFLCILLLLLAVAATMAAPVIQKGEHGATTGFAATGADKMSDMKKSHKVPHSSPELAQGGAAAAGGGIHAPVRIGMLAGSNETSNETVAVSISLR